MRPALAPLPPGWLDRAPWHARARRRRLARQAVESARLEHAARYHPSSRLAAAAGVPLELESIFARDPLRATRPRTPANVRFLSPEALGDVLVYQGKTTNPVPHI